MPKRTQSSGTGKRTPKHGRANAAKRMPADHSQPLIALLTTVSFPALPAPYPIDLDVANRRGHRGFPMHADDAKKLPRIHIARRSGSRTPPPRRSADRLPVNACHAFCCCANAIGSLSSDDVYLTALSWFWRTEPGGGKMTWQILRCPFYIPRQPPMSCQSGHPVVVPYVPCAK